MLAVRCPPLSAGSNHSAKTPWRPAIGNRFHMLPILFGEAPLRYSTESTERASTDGMQKQLPFNTISPLKKRWPCRIGSPSICPPVNPVVPKVRPWPSRQEATPRGRLWQKFPHHRRLQNCQAHKASPRKRAPADRWFWRWIEFEGFGLRWQLSCSCRTFWGSAPTRMHNVKIRPSTTKIYNRVNYACFECYDEFTLCQVSKLTVRMVSQNVNEEITIKNNCYRSWEAQSWTTTKKKRSGFP